jgi:hypothetical protein
MLPTDGLWFDDSWVAAGAVFGAPSQILSVGSTHPTFTLSLMGIDRLGGGDQAFVVPALVAGVLAPALLFALARRCGLGAGAAGLAAAALATSEILVTYAGRAKPYTLDVVVVLVVAAAMPVVTRLRWRWPHGVAWVVCAWLIGGISAPMLLVTAVAGGVVFLHASGDRLVRAVAVAVQGVGQLLFIREVRARADFSGIDRDIVDFYDPYLDLSLDPRDSAVEVVEHLHRIAQIFPGRGGLLGAVLVAASIGGLVFAALRGRTRAERIVGRYLALLVAAAFLGAVAGTIPFGGRNTSPPTFGGRYNLWLVAPLAFGAAAALHHLVERLGARVERVALGSLVAAAAVVLLVGGLPAGPPYPFPGSASAAAALDEAVGPGDRVIIVSSSSYSFPLGSTTPFEVVLAREVQVGFALQAADDERFLTIGPWAPDPPSFDLISAHIATTDRVFVIGSGPLFGTLDVAEQELVASGFELVDEQTYEWNVVWEWERA